MFTQIGDQFITKFGDKIGDHQIWHLIRWQICHQIWWTPNMSPNNSPNLVTTLSPKRVLTDFVTKFVTIFCTKFGDHWICHRIWWQIWCRICHQKCLESYLNVQCYKEFGLKCSGCPDASEQNMNFLAARVSEMVLNWISSLPAWYNKRYLDVLQHRAERSEHMCVWLTQCKGFIEHKHAVAAVRL